MDLRHIRTKTLQHVHRVCISPDGSKIAAIDTRGCDIRVYSTESFELLGRMQSDAIPYRMYTFTKNGNYIVCTSRYTNTISYISATSCLRVAEVDISEYILGVHAIENNEADGGSECVVYTGGHITLYDQANQHSTTLFTCRGVNKKCKNCAVSKNIIAAYIQCNDDRVDFRRIHIWTKTDGIWNIARMFVPNLPFELFSGALMISGLWLVLVGDRRAAYWNVMTPDPHSFSVELSFIVGTSPLPEILTGEACVQEGVKYYQVCKENDFRLFAYDLVTSDLLYHKHATHSRDEDLGITEMVMSDDRRVLCCTSAKHRTVTLFDVTHHDWDLQKHTGFPAYVRDRVLTLLFLYAQRETSPSVIGLLPFELYVLLCEYVVGF